jgi:RNA polymerase sigma factor (sigma-70 family)
MNDGPITAVLDHIRRQTAADAARDVADDRLLARFLAEHDETAFAVLLHRHGPMVWRVCRRALRHRQDAEDVFQATFLTLVRKARAIRKHESLAAWLHGVAFRLARRVQSRQGRTISTPLDPAHSAGDLADQASGKEEQAIFDEELARLCEAYRVPLVLCYLEGKTRDEAAEQLGWSFATLKRRLEAGRKLLAQRLLRRGVQLGAVLLGVAVVQDSVLAAVPPTLSSATCQAASLVAAGAATGDVLSAPVAHLTDGMVATLTAGRLKLAALIPDVSKETIFMATSWVGQLLARTVILVGAGAIILTGVCLLTRGSEKPAAGGKQAASDEPGTRTDQKPNGETGASESKKKPTSKQVASTRQEKEKKKPSDRRDQSRRKKESKARRFDREDREFFRETGWDDDSRERREKERRSRRREREREQEDEDDD